MTVDGETWFATCCYDMWEFIPVRFMQKEPVSKNKKLYSEKGSVFWEVFGFPPGMPGGAEPISEQTKGTATPGGGTQNPE